MATKKYLDENGVLYFWQKIKSIFAKQSDLTALSARVDGIVSEGGEPNVIDVIQVNGTAQTVTVTPSLSADIYGSSERCLPVWLNVSAPLKNAAAAS